MSELAKFVDNGNKFALPVKALFTGKLGKPVLPVFTNFYRYKFTTLLKTYVLKKPERMWHLFYQLRRRRIYDYDQ